MYVVSVTFLFCIFTDFRKMFDLIGYFLATCISKDSNNLLRLTAAIRGGAGFLDLGGPIMEGSGDGNSPSGVLGQSPWLGSGSKAPTS